MSHGHTFKAESGYADDVALILPSASSLKQMLKFADKFGTETKFLYS